VNFRRSSNTATPPGTAFEAADWLVRLSDEETDPDEPYPNGLDRQNAFFDWLERSPAHLRAFLEVLATERRLRQLEPLRDIDVRTLLQRRSAEVIRLFAPTDESRGKTPIQPPPAAAPRPRRWRPVAAGVAAALCALTVGPWLYVDLIAPTAYATGLGEQRTCKLKDGSIVYLNTDSRVEVQFDKQGRDVWLERGEALFVVEHDASRPFIVHAGDSQVRAVGTQFDVYRRDNATTVSVVEGVVQIATVNTSRLTSANPTRVTAGEGADVHAGQVTAHPLQNVASAASWRERRLVFTDAPLSEVAHEFNRYNRTRVRVEGAAGNRLRLTGIFDADRPQALILYALKSNTLDVVPDGNDWVIRER
jgi:transmembrane sensor